MDVSDYIDYVTVGRFDRQIRTRLLAIITLLLMSVNVLLAAEARTLNDGVYTKEQSAIGATLYAEHCILCHDKKYFRPVLKRWEGQPIGILFTVMSASMPESNPGFLSEKEYVDILAYILSLSRYASGETELTYEGGALNSMNIEPRARK